MQEAATPATARWEETPGHAKGSETPGATPSTRVWDATPGHATPGHATPGRETPANQASRRNRWDETPKTERGDYNLFVCNLITYPLKIIETLTSKIGIVLLKSTF